MIVDLMRNDLGKVGRMSRPPNYRGCPLQNPLPNDFHGDLPAGSKAEIPQPHAGAIPLGVRHGSAQDQGHGNIAGLEGEDRRIYTGTIGYITRKGHVFQHTNTNSINRRREWGNGDWRRNCLGFHTEGEWAEVF